MADCLFVLSLTRYGLDDLGKPLLRTATTTNPFRRGEQWSEFTRRSAVCEGGHFTLSRTLCHRRLSSVRAFTHRNPKDGGGLVCRLLYGRLRRV